MRTHIRWIGCLALGLVAVGCGESSSAGAETEETESATGNNESSTGSTSSGTATSTTGTTTSTSTFTTTGDMTSTGTTTSGTDTMMMTTTTGVCEPASPPNCDAAPVGGSVLLFDDMENGELDIEAVDGRTGTWYSFDDGTGGTRTFEITDSDANTGTYAMHFGGVDFLDWGVGMGVPLNSGCAYDMAAFDGISLWARGTGTMQVQLPSNATVPPQSTATGGVCDECEGSCWDHFDFDIELTDEWTQYTFTWDELAQEGWGQPVSFDPQSVIYLEFYFSAARTEVEAFVDDIAFIEDAGGSGTGGSSTGGGSDSSGTASSSTG